jgi:hypothetical protein
MRGANMRQPLPEDHGDKVGRPTPEPGKLFRILLGIGSDSNEAFMEADSRSSIVPEGARSSGRTEFRVCRTTLIRAAQDRAARIRAGQARAAEVRASQVCAA